MENVVLNTGDAIKKVSLFNEKDIYLNNENVTYYVHKHKLNNCHYLLEAENQVTKKDESNFFRTLFRLMYIGLFEKI